MKKNDEYIVKIEDLGTNGEGVARVDGQVVFVPFALPGETVKIVIINTKSKIAIGKVLEIIEASPDRVVAKCPYFEKCGGCDLQHLQYDKALEQKTQIVAKNIKNIGKIDAKVKKCIASSPYGYRNKCTLPIGFDGKKTIIGMYRENTHKIVEIESCAICGEYVKDIIKIIKEFILRFNLKGYDEESGEGLLRHVSIRLLDNCSVVTIVATSAKIPGIQWLCGELEKTFSNLNLWINVNK
ncbi:MAG: class I SAM-dependent RNA methyltransferase, partial [Clostridia bacterium]|nr:class I SAM-dependent RNA methyltransferase [Clostridia bacterium]